MFLAECLDENLVLDLTELKVWRGSSSINFIASSWLHARTNVCPREPSGRITDFWGKLGKGLL